MSNHPVNWFHISGPDAKTLVSFYKRVFEWQMDPGPDGDPNMMMVAPGKGGIPGGVGASQNGQPSVTVYAAVGDLQKSLAKISQAGGKLAMAPMDLPGGMGTIAGFTDPAGNWVGLWSAPKPVPASVLETSGAASKESGATAKRAAPAKKAAPAPAKKAAAPAKKAAPAPAKKKAAPAKKAAAPAKKAPAKKAPANAKKKPKR